MEAPDRAEERVGMPEGWEALPEAAVRRVEGEEATEEVEAARGLVWEAELAGVEDRRAWEEMEEVRTAELASSRSWQGPFACMHLDCPVVDLWSPSPQTT